MLQKCGSTVLAKIRREVESHIFLLMFQITAGIAPCSQPIGSMYGRFTYIRLISMVNESKYTVHGSYEKAAMMIVVLLMT